MIRIRPYKAADANTILSWCQDEKAFYRFFTLRNPNESSAVGFNDVVLDAPETYHICSLSSR